MRSLLFIKWTNGIVNKLIAIQTLGNFYSIADILKKKKQQNGEKAKCLAIVYFWKLNLDKHWKLPNFVEYISCELHRIQDTGDVFGTTAFSGLDINRNVQIATGEKLSLLFQMAGYWDYCFYYKKKKKILPPGWKANKNWPYEPSWIKANLFL